jgi:iron complex outermembrane recepter protein
VTNCAKLILLSSAAAIFLTGGAQGATNAPGTIETVVVTAEKRSEDIQAVPISIQAFTSKQISDLGIKASTDLSQFTPNLDIALPAGNGNQPIITIRGVGLNDYDTNNAGPNGIYLDEVYLSSPASQTFQAFDLERIEVLKGPQGTLYGRNTSGGAINFISAKPTDEFTGNFHGEYGAFGTYQLEGAIGGQITDGLDGRIAVVHNGSGGYTLNALTGTRENGANNYAGRAQLLWKPTTDLSFLLSVQGGSVANRPAEYRHLGASDPNTGELCTFAQVYARNSTCIDLFGYGTPTNFYGGAFNRRQHLQVHSFGTTLRGDYTMGDISFTSISAFQSNDKLHPEDSDSSPNRLLEIDFGVRNSTFTQELRATQSTDSYDWVLGAYYLSETLRQSQPLYILLDADLFFGGPGSGDGIAEIITDHSRQATNSYAIFGQGDYRITDALKLTLGGRFTGESKSFRYSQTDFFQLGGMDHFDAGTPIATNIFRTLSNTSFNFRAAVDYHVTDDVLTYFSVATGFKSGGFNGSFLSSDPAQIDVQLQPIKPENVTAYELGMKSSWLDNRLIFNLSAFYNDYRNLQVFILAPVPGTNLATNILANARNAHMMGMDVEVNATPIDNLRLTAQLGLLQAKVDSSEVIGGDDLNPILDHGKQLPLAPHVTASTLVDYKIPFEDGNFDLQFSANYKSHQNFDLLNTPILTQRAYWLENARVSYTFDEDRWEVAAFARNLSGQKYFLDAFDLSFLGLYQGILGQPRTYGAEVNYRF